MSMDETNVVELLVILETPTGTWQGKGRWPEPQDVEGWKRLCSEVLWGLASGVLSRSPELQYVNLTVFATGLVFQKEEPDKPINPYAHVKLCQHREDLSWSYAAKDLERGG